MEAIKNKVKKIEDFWRDYFWDYKYLLEKIQYDKQKQSNYPGVVFGYLHDTLPIIENYFDREFSNSDDNFFNTIGLLQVIFVQQDLIDELLQVFGLEKSLLTDKEPNRTLRNDLIGHPIRRIPNESKKGLSPKSYSLFSYDSSKLNIEYLRYARENDYAFEAVEHNTEVVINDHLNFMNKYLDLIIMKIKPIFNDFKNQITDILESIDKLEFQKLINLIESRFEDFFTNDRTYDKLYINYCYENAENHQRYSYAVDCFKEDLIEAINYVTDFIDNSFDNNESYDNVIYVIKGENEIPTLSIGFDDENYFTTQQREIASGYALGKLSENHPIFGIQYFKKHFSDSPKIMEELNNMEANLNSPEFYCSYNYLRYFLLNDER